MQGHEQLPPQPPLVDNSAALAALVARREHIASLCKECEREAHQIAQEGHRLEQEVEFRRRTLQADHDDLCARFQGMQKQWQAAQDLLDCREDSHRKHVVFLCERLRKARKNISFDIESALKSSGAAKDPAKEAKLGELEDQCLELEQLDLMKSADDDRETVERLDKRQQELLDEADVLRQRLSQVNRFGPLGSRGAAVFANSGGESAQGHGGENGLRASGILELDAVLNRNCRDIPSADDPIEMMHSVHRVILAMSKGEHPGKICNDSMI